MNPPDPSGPFQSAPPPPAKPAANPLGGLVILVVIGFVGWYFLFRSPGSPGTTSPTQRPTNAPAAFADISLSGTGDSVKAFTIPASSAAIATLTYTGSGNFIVHTLGVDGSDNDLLVNVIGRYSGTVLFDTSLHSTALQVETTGSWTATIKSPSKARAWSPSSAASGQGDDDLRLNPTSSGLTTITLRYAGDGNFIVKAYGSSSDLLVNEIGAYSGTVAVPSGTVLLTVEAAGSWTIQP